MKIYTILLILISFTLVIVSGCTEEASIPPTTKNTITGFATDDIAVSHTKGVDPCPTEGSEKITVRCYNTDTYTDCQADSFAIKKPSNGLNTIIPGVVGQSAQLPQDGSSLEILVQFTCDIAESFYHAYDFVFYKDGVEIATERVEVDVFVN